MTDQPEKCERPHDQAGTPAPALAWFRSRCISLERALRWPLAVALLSLAIWILSRNPEPLRRLVALPALFWISLMPLAILNGAFIAWRMSLAMSQAGGARVPALAWFRIVSLGQFLSLFLPQSGNVYRGVTLKREFGISYLTYATGLVTLVWLDTLCGFLLCFLVVGFLAPETRLGPVPVLQAMSMVLVALAIAPAAVAKLFNNWKFGGRVAPRAHEQARMLLTGVRNALASPRFLLKFTTLSACITVNQILLLWLCFRATRVSIDVPTAAVFQLIVKLSNQVIITPGNLGLTELTFGMLGATVEGVGPEHGVAAALVFRTLFTVTIVLLGVSFGGIRLFREMGTSLRSIGSGPAE